MHFELKPKYKYKILLIKLYWKANKNNKSVLKKK